MAQIAWSSRSGHNHKKKYVELFQRIESVNDPQKQSLPLRRSRLFHFQFLSDSKKKSTVVNFSHSDTIVRGNIYDNAKIRITVYARQKENRKKLKKPSYLLIPSMCSKSIIQKINIWLIADSIYQSIFPPIIGKNALLVDTNLLVIFFNWILLKV